MSSLVIQEANLRGTIQQTVNLVGSIQNTASLRGNVYIPQIFHESGSDQTYILIDDFGHEVTAVVSGGPVTLDATPNDIRLGKTAATTYGVTTGEKEIPAYYVTEGHKVILSGQSFSVRVSKYDYTKMQALTCKFNGSMLSSVETDKVSIESKVYPVNSTDVISMVVIDHESKSIDLGITNESDEPYILRFFSYKEMY